MLDIFATAMEKLDELWNVMVRGAWFTGPAAFFAAVADWFGWPYGGTALVAGLVTMDWILGLSRAAATHTLSGSRFKAGILKWCVWLVVFAMAAGVRRSFPDDEPAKWLANFMIINVAIVELVSVLRNGLALSIALNVKINGLDFVLERIESIRRMKKEIGKVTNDGEHVLSIEGPLDISTASEMKDQAYRILEQHRRISFDFHAVKFVDSEGLSVLVGTANHAGAIGVPPAEIEIRDAPPHLMRLLVMTKLIDKFALKTTPKGRQTMSAATGAAKREESVAAAG